MPRETFPPGDPRHGGMDASKAGKIAQEPILDVPPEAMPPTPFEDLPPPIEEDDIGAVQKIMDEAPAPKVIEPPEVKDPEDQAIAEALDQTTQGVDLNLVGADDLEEEDEPAPEAAPPPPAPRAGGQGPMHACSLPKVLMPKKALAAYLKRHQIKMSHRDSIEYTPTERRLYEVYVKAVRGQRVSKGHFVAALRLWRHGYPINPAEELVLNSMKIGD